MTFQQDTTVKGIFLSLNAGSFVLHLAPSFARLELTTFDDSSASVIGRQT